MSRYWEYPIYLIPHGGGYASIVDPNAQADAAPSQMLVVYTESEVAVRFMSEFGMADMPRMLFNDREFSWLLQGLRAPVTDVAFDPSPLGDKSDARWQVAVRELLDEHLTADYSPWNYPVYAVAQEKGFVSIDGAGSHGESLTVLGLFTSEAKAMGYLEAANESGELCTLMSLDEARTFLSALTEQIAAVALDPIVDRDQRIAKHCFPLETLLNKYLVRDE
ncbi:MAG: hypothetical protein O3C40_29870 [Planctomycetota bacterium]|nr:hypothetical protein [Planctomycetota bacterium]